MIAPTCRTREKMDEFEELVDQHYQALYRFGFSLARNPDRAVDLVQQTFVIWAQKGHQLKDRSKAKAWLFTTLYREYLGITRQSQRSPEMEISEAEHELPHNEENSGRRMDAQRAVTLLGELDEIFRAPLTLFYLQQHSYKEIASILGVPIGTVMSRISRGKDQLRRKMNAESAEVATRIVEFQPDVIDKTNG